VLDPSVSSGEYAGLPMGTRERVGQ